MKEDDVCKSFLCVSPAPAAARATDRLSSGMRFRGFFDPSKKNHRFSHTGELAEGTQRFILLMSTLLTISFFNMNCNYLIVSRVFDRISVYVILQVLHKTYRT